MGDLQIVRPLTEIKNIGGRAGLGDDIVLFKHVDMFEMPGGCPSGNVYPKRSELPNWCASGRGYRCAAY